MLGFIGGGKMAEALIKGILNSNLYKSQDILVSELKFDRQEYLKKNYKVSITSDNKNIAQCDVIILAVKPQDIQDIMVELSSIITNQHTVVSIVAGIKLDYLKSKLNTPNIIRVMPNAPALINEAMSVISLSCGCCINQAILSSVRGIFMCIGKVMTLPEKQLNAVTALSGSGPAFISLFLEAMTEAGSKIGLNETISQELVIQTLIGTAKLIETGLTPKKIREMVTSPNGTTEAGLKIFEEKLFNDIVINAISSAYKRAEELGK